MQAPPRDASLISLLAELRMAFARHRHGWHRLVIAPSPQHAETEVRAIAKALDARAYAIHLRAWLRDDGGVADVLQPYRNLSRSVAPPTLALVHDTPVLFDVACGSWRTDAFRSRLMRRSLISSSLPTFWWIPRSGAAGLELSVLAPEYVCESVPAANYAAADATVEPCFIVRALDLPV